MKTENQLPIDDLYCYGTASDERQDTERPDGAQGRLFLW